MDNTTGSDVFLTEKQLAEQFPFSLGWIRKQRLEGKGFPWHKVVGKVLYKERDVLDYIESCRQTPGGDS